MFVLEEVHKRLERRYDGPEGEAYEIVTYQNAPDPYPTGILLVETELEKKLGFLQVVFVDISKAENDPTAVLTLANLGFTAHDKDTVFSVAESVFYAVTSKLYRGWN
jgi:hypothetical protein